MRHKILLVVIGTLSSIIVTSCGLKKDTMTYNNSYEIFNNWYDVSMNDGALYMQNDRAYIIDYTTMKTNILCNIPNCSHSSSDCIVKILTNDNQLPIIYNGCAYYFVNSSSYQETNGKTVLNLKTKIEKYDFKNRTISEVAMIENFNANVSGGCYLIDSDYYFTTNYGNPKYDEAGNVVRNSSGGGGNLFSVNLDSGKITDYGEIFDYEELKDSYSAASNSTTIYLMGKLNRNLYIGVHYLRDEVTPELIESGGLPPFYGETYTFNLDTHVINKIDNKFSTCSMNGYHTYFSNSNDAHLIIENVENGELIDGPEVYAYNALSVLDGKVWHDSKCFDMKTGIDKEVSLLLGAHAICEYEDWYIIKGETENGDVVFERIPKSILE